MKRMSLSASLMILALFVMALPAGAWTYLPCAGDYGWQTYTSPQPLGPGTYVFGFVESNVYDNHLEPVLLVTGLSVGGVLLPNGDFTDGLNGYNPQPTGGPGIKVEATSGSVQAASGKLYAATDVGYSSMARIGSPDLFGNFDTVILPYADTSQFVNSQRSPGTGGAILETTPITLSTSGNLSFKWAFLCNDGSPGLDFALFYVNRIDPDPLMTITGAAQIVPLPGSFLLLTSGLGGLAAFRVWTRKRS
jgi:hypothetical protein